MLLSRLGAALFGCIVAVPLAAALELDVPVACPIGEVCFIQNYVDQDAGPGRLDYACGRLSYDGHDGTDFRVRDHVDMAQGYEVVAAADGVVLAVRDGMEDINVNDIGVAAVRGREAGNGVLVDHGHGWQTQYSHLRRDSIEVAVGDTVAKGDVLGLVGLSGHTEFPHVEFTVRFEGEPVDPFTGPGYVGGCEATQTPLWSTEALDVLTYQRTGLLVAGFAESAPEAEAARRGAFRLGDAAPDPDALVFWVDLFGAEAGDTERFRIIAPDGTAFIDRSNTLEASNVSWFAFSGRRRPADGWPEGMWHASYELTRDGDVIVAVERTIRLGGG